MKVARSFLIFGDPFHIRYFANFLKLFDNLRKVLLTDISDGIPCLFVFLLPYFGLEIQSCCQPPNLATTTIFHVHRLKQIFLACEHEK